MKYIGYAILLGTFACCGTQDSDTQVKTESESKCRISCCQYLDSSGQCWPYEYDPQGICACVDPEYSKEQ